MSLSADKKKELNKLISNFKKNHKFEDDIPIGFLAENEKMGLIEHLRTGNIGIDVISNGGIVKGKVNIIYGSENCGKSTLMLDTIAYCQKQNPDFVAAYCDNEKVFDREYAESKGIDPERLIVGAGFKSAENAYDFCNDVANSNLVDLLVVDTIQALASIGELGTDNKLKSTEANSMALIPRLLSQFLRMYTSSSQGNTTLCLLSQVRLDLGSFIATKKKTGGQAIDHYNILNLGLRSTKAHSGNDKDKTKWPWTIATANDAPPKSFTVLVKIDKAKMKDRYDGNSIAIHFHKGIFERKLNVLSIAKQLDLHDGKTLNYQTTTGTGDGGQTIVDQEFKAKGFRDMYNKIPDEAIDYLESILINEYTKYISIDKEQEEDE